MTAEASHPCQGGSMSSKSTTPQAESRAPARAAAEPMAEPCWRCLGSGWDDPGGYYADEDVCEDVCAECHGTGRATNKEERNA